MAVVTNIKQFWLVTPILSVCTVVEAGEPAGYAVNGIGNDSCASFVLALQDYQPTNTIITDGKTYYTMVNAYTQWLRDYRRPGLALGAGWGGQGLDVAGSPVGL